MSIRPKERERKQETAPFVTVGAEDDRVYLDTPGRCAIEDAGGAAGF